MSLASLPVLYQRTAARLQKTTRDGFSIAVSESGSSEIVDVVATSRDPTEATDAANKYAEIFISYVGRQQNGQLASAMAALNRALAVAKRNGASDVSALQASLGQLEAVRAVGPLNVSIAQKASGASSSRGSRVDVIVAGALLGFLVGVLGAFLSAFADPRMRALGEARADMPLVRLETRRRRRASGDRINVAAPDKLASRVLAETLSGDSQSHCVLLIRPDDYTDPSAVTRTGLSLAEGLAMVGPDSRTLFVDFQGSPATLAAPPRASIRGWEAVLYDGIPLSHAVEEATGQLRAAMLLSRSPVPLVDGGRELLELLAEARRQYRYIVIAAPPFDASSVARALTPMVDAVCSVVQIQRTRRAAVDAALISAQNAGAREPLLVISAPRARRASPDVPNPYAIVGVDPQSGSRAAPSELQGS